MSGTVGSGGASATAGHGGATGTAGTGGGAAAAGPRVSDFLGLNGFIDDPIDKLAAIGNVREYHNWSWNDGNGATGYPGYPNNQLSFSLFSGFWDFDAYYAALDQSPRDGVSLRQGICRLPGECDAARAGGR